MSTTTTRTQAQQKASRKNGTLSHGAVTPEGKARSSTNALKHGLRSSRVVLCNESQEKYARYLDSYIAEWHPVGITESDLLTQMVNARWRIRRIQSMESGTIDNEMYIQKPSMDAAFSLITPEMRQSDAVTTLSITNPNSLDYFTRSEDRLERTFDRARKQLVQLQTTRLGHPPQLVPQPGFDAVESSPAGTSDTNEPDITGPNYLTPETFARISLFIPTKQRPSNIRTKWTDDTCPPPDEKVA